MAADEENYPCTACGAPRTKAQGGTVFTVCDTCWDKHVAPEHRTTAKLVADRLLREARTLGKIRRAGGEEAAAREALARVCVEYDCLLDEAKA